MQISIGMALVRGAGALISYLLRDEFTTDRAAGAVNGTAAEPGPGTRVVTDTGSNMTISGGLLTVAGSPATIGVPRLLYGSVLRVAGRLIKAEFSGSGNSPYIGFSTTLSISSTAHMEQAFYVFPGASLLRWANGSINVAAIASATSYTLVMILRTSGGMGFIKGGVFTNWTLVWISSSENTSTLYPGVSAVNVSVSWTNDYIRIPTDLWLPTPLCSDGFASAFGTTDGLGHAEGVAGGIGAGGSGLTWTGATWSVSGAKAINTPGLGSELIPNGDLETWTTATDPGTWSESVGGGNTINQETTEIHGGANSARYNIAVNNNCLLSQNITTVTGRWYRKSFWAKSAVALSFASNLGPSKLFTLITGNWTQYVHTGRATATVTSVGTGYNSGTTPSTVYVDDISAMELTLSNLFASVSASTADVVSDVNIVVTSGTQAGLVLNLDSTGTPANFVIAYHDGTNAILEKCVGGVYTTVITAAATYSAGATLRVTKIGTAYRLYYNNALVGSGTISDAGIISNSRHGLFSTYSQNSLDNFVLYASGSEGQYSNLDAY